MRGQKKKNVHRKKDKEKKENEKTSIIDRVDTEQRGNKVLSGRLCHGTPDQLSS